MNHREARERAREAVTADTSLTRAERETTLRFAEWDETASFYTTERGLMNRILAHPAAAVKSLNVLDEAGSSHADPLPLEEYDGGPVVGVEATLPVGVLKIQKTPRSTTGHAPIISKAVLETTRADGGRETDAPDVASVARRLGTDPARLQAFVRHHPDPTAAAVLEAFDGDGARRAVVASWIRAESRRQEQRRERLQNRGEHE